MIKLYFPGSNDLSVDYVGYNHAVSLFNKSLSDRITNNPMEADYVVYCNLPWHHNPKQLKVIGLPIFMYTMYESDKVPASWIRFINKHVEVVAVPSLWCKKVFKESGVNRPIFVLTLGYDPEVISYIPKTEMKELYVYLWQGVALDSGGRKGVDLVKKAYRELRKENRIGSDTRLILKTRPFKEDVLKMNVNTPEGIIYIQDDLTRTQLKDLYKKVDCCVNPTHGEGFGLIPLEQMAMGKCVLVTDWSIPYIHDEYCIPLKYDLKLSPVVWNHKFLNIGLNGMSYNAGGMVHEISFLPKPLNLKPDGRKTKSLLPPGMVAKKLSLFTILFNRIYNVVANIQRGLHLYKDSKRRSYTLYQENQGRDAWIDIDNLKNKMEWCYNNRSKAEDLGFLAHHHVSKFWTIDKMFSDLLHIEQKLQK